MAGLNAHTEAHVTSASKLTEGQSRALTEVLMKKFNKPVDFTETVDTSLIGGLRVRVNGRILDNTIKKQLNDLKENIVKGAAG
jgi:F-type H+-transporting ATPase subunit delta